MASVTRSFRGISRRAARMYLERLGGDIVDDDRVVGDGWTATLSADTVEVGPTLTLSEVTVTVEGDADAVEALLAAFEQKAMRAGG